MKILITGGCGFIGTNLASYFAKKHEVTVCDSLIRKGSEKNLKWLKVHYPQIRFVQAEITDFTKIKRIVLGQNVILHLAAQVAVTSSLTSPRTDFTINTSGTLNVLEAVRLTNPHTLVIYASTNKVYGEIKGAKIKESKTGYLDLTHPFGINEKQPLDFYSPYACSKGAADSYVFDYARSFGLKTVVLRQSCIYGPHQFGTSDQGWVSFFIKSALSNKTITVYGNGRQVRDLLYIDDLVRLYEAIIINSKKIKKSTGLVLNIGGGSQNSVSLLELITRLEKILKKKIKVQFSKARIGDQKVYISNIRKAREVFNWQPRVPLNKGLIKLINWAKQYP